MQEQCIFLLYGKNNFAEVMRVDCNESAKDTKNFKETGATVTEFLVFTLPLLVFLVILYGTLL